MQRGFMEKFGFPKAIGCIDGSHIPIVAPNPKEAIYVNRNSYHSTTSMQYVMMYSSLLL